ncbi:hypothetical protein Q4512_10075 [Oceanihabitans sp. 2_MG-2023]|uniref:hypothetical protein n=1 Tax=Oceanihabitans sp. 2_MG-2023 TaxID=3062661 RepID=UPI0026E445F9|nr:hypothetical protein [Oceanihabitans sp. 2_MG-2023]MDO6597260.1 hypothetical protein [Oceanihabitans sp. 2_MG-2023]
MAKNNSFIRLEGTLDGLTFFRKNGDNFVKTKSNVSKKRILNDPAYKRTRENMQEFGGAARCGKAFRESFSGIARLVGDNYLSARITGIMRNVVSNGIGTRGSRSINVVDNSATFFGFNFDKTKPFDSQFNAPNVGPTINASRDTVTWSIPDFNTETYINIPEGATHCKLALAAGYTSNYEWEPALKSYEPVEENANGHGDVSYSDAIALSGMVGAATDLTVDLTAYAPIPATTSLFAGTAIVFYQMVNGELYALAQGHCMQIAAAG